MPMLFDEDTKVGNHPRIIRFVGDGVTVTQSGRVLTVTIPGGGGAGDGIVGPGSTTVGRLAVWDVTDGTSLTEGALPYTLIAASTSSAAIKAAAAYICDGVADEVQINAALAVDDKLPIVLAPGVYHTAAPVAYTDSVKHDLIGSNPDYTEIRANHTGNAVEVHSALLPQEWRCTIDGILINKGATNTPARGLSLVSCAYLTVRNVRVKGTAVGLHQDFALLNTFDGCTIGDCPVGTTITGSTNKYSNANKYRSCAWRNNDVDLDFVACTESNHWSGCTFEDHGSNDLSVRVANDSTIRTHVFDTCWWEMDPAATGAYFFRYNGGRRFRFVNPRCALAATQKVFDPAGTGGRDIRYIGMHVSDGRSLADLPPGITVTDDLDHWFDVAMFDALGDGAQNDTAPIQRAIEAAGAEGGTITGPKGTYLLNYVGAAPGLTAVNYCLLVDETHGPITFDFPPGTVFKLGNGQSVKNVCPLVIGGQSGSYRLEPTTIRGLTFDGNYSGNFGAAAAPDSDDFGLLTTIYARGVTVEGCTFRNWTYAGAHILRDSTFVRFARCSWDGTIAGFDNVSPTEGSKPSLRIEVHDITVDQCRFVTDAVSGQPHMAVGCNADVDLQGRFMRITNNLFAGGYAGPLVGIDGVTHSIIAGNVFRDVCDLAGFALRLSLYTNTNGTYWEGAYNVVTNNVFFNVRQGIQLAGDAKVLAGTNITTGAFNNQIKHNIITRSFDTLRTQIGGGNTYPDVYQAAPNVTQVNLNVGIQEYGQDKTSGTATSGGANTLTNSGASMGTTQYVNYILVVTGGTGRGQWRKINSHTATAFTLNQNWDVVPDSTSTYRVTNLVGHNEISGNIIDVTTTAGVGIQSTAWLPSTFRDNRVYGTTGANSFQFGTAANNPNAMFSGNKGYAGSPGIASPYSHVVYQDENAGLGTIASGATSVTITHKLGRTPLAQQLRVLMTNSPTNDPGYLYVTAIGATTFDVGCRADPGSGGATFAWAATGTL